MQFLSSILRCSLISVGGRGGGGGGGGGGGWCQQTLSRTDSCQIQMAADSEGVDFYESNNINAIQAVS